MARHYRRRSLILGIGSYFTVLAFREVDIPAVAPFRYTLLFWMGLSGYSFLARHPDRWAVMGTSF